MGLVLPLGIAKMVFYSLTLWNSFKALKVPKHRRKIPRPVINRSNPIPIPIPIPIQTEPSSDPLNTTQKLRRARIKEMTKVYLVWACWTHSKRFLDWIAWAIPWYDEFNLAFLIWLIIMGPSAADTVFKYTIERMAKPYEHSFDLVLGTTHDALHIIMYLITCGPKSINLKWQSWKARQFNKSLLSTSIPRSKLPVLNRYPSHFQPPKMSTTLASDRGGHSTVSSTSATSTYLLVPEKKRTLSRTLSAGYKRAVSNSRPKPFLGDPGLFSTRSVSINRAVYPFGARTLPDPSTTYSTHHHYHHQPLQPSSKPNMQSSRHHLSPHLHDDEVEETNSIIIHDDSILSQNEPAPNSIYAPPVQLPRQKRARNANDELDALALRKAKKAVRAASTTTRPEKSRPSKSIKSSLRVPSHPSAATTTIRATHQAVNPSSIMSTETYSLTDLPALDDSGDLAAGDMAAVNMAWQPLPTNAAFPEPDRTISPSRAPPPTGQRRLHDPNEPLPLSKSMKADPHHPSPPNFILEQHQDIREQALDSVRSLTSTDCLPSLNRSTGRLASRFPAKNPSPAPLRSASSNNSSPHHSKRASSSKPKPLARKRQISGKLGQEKVIMAAKKFDLLHSPSAPSCLKSSACPNTDHLELQYGSTLPHQGSDKPQDLTSVESGPDLHPHPSHSSLPSPEH
ncbi:hypothetical protein PCANC_24524 [Puccinia coronata f. sp. avenae]|uniref:Protein YOP1 n=1 Tax=Puccinia coronata f. sp. avenae TaxID=200324 RepID=A0A2N5TXB7_9BASI|nr:hypothetical protein PCANC_24524 [Puccinia coronata f. sp. avenae]PLW45112.1 hypothetical protein PCASD_04531 [Puccinia coronata f. sp. avenae]